MTTLNMCLFLRAGAICGLEGGLEPLLGLMLAVLGRSWSVCWRSWAALGVSVGGFGVSWGLSGRSWAKGVSLGRGSGRKSDPNPSGGLSGQGIRAEKRSGPPAFPNSPKAPVHFFLIDVYVKL